MNKKYLLTVFIILAIAFVVSVFYLSRKKEPTATIVPQKPSIPSAITGSLPIKTSLKESDFDFPAELPMISITQRILSKEDVETFLNKLGMGTTLDEFGDVNEGVKYYKNSDTHFFVATPKTSVVKYGMSNSEFPIVVSKNIGNTGLVKIATDFIVQNGFYTEEQIKPLPVLYLKTSPTNEGFVETDSLSAQLFQIGFVFKSSGYEIVTDSSEGQQIFVQVLPNGTIYNSEIMLVDEIKEGITRYPLKNYGDLTNSLSQAKLISFSGDYISPSDFTIKDILSLEIESVRLVYFLEKTKPDMLQPIFILEGPAQVSKSTANYATIYLPAFK